MLREQCRGGARAPGPDFLSRVSLIESIHMSTKNRLRLPLLALGLLAATSLTASGAQHDKDEAKDEKLVQVAPEKATFAGDPYLLDTDPVTGKKLPALADQVVIQFEDREFRFANKENEASFRAAPARFIASVDAALVKQQLPFYPLQTCPVSGEELGGMGAPVDFIYRNRLVRFCCDGCKPKFLADPAKFIAKLDAAVVAEQGAKYPLSTCAVSGEELGGEMGAPVDYVVGNRLVRLCCSSCAKKVAKSPLETFAKLDEAAKSARVREAGAKHEEHEGHDDGKDD